MSDNGVIIFETKGPQYRVAIVNNIDSIYFGIDDNTSKWVPNGLIVHELFDQAPSYNSLELALDKATELSYNVTLESGIRHIRDFKDRLYTEL